MAPPPLTRLSVIVPTLNEAKRIKPLLAWLGRLNGVEEVIVSDGGSDDGTLEVVRGFEFPGNLRVETGSAGRALQLNRAAALATGDTLFFLHADTLPPRDSAYWIRRTLAESGVVAGAFRTWHVTDQALEVAPEVSPWWLHLADLRSRYTSLPYGDQGLFITRREFEAAGGYPEQPLMEDLEFSRRLRRRGVIRTAPASMRVSARRFEAHPIRDTWLVNVFPILYTLGVSPTRLAAWYRNVR